MRLVKRKQESSSKLAVTTAQDDVPVSHFLLKSEGSEYWTLLFSPVMMLAMSDPARQRLADYVIARRMSLGMRDRRDLADAASLSERTVGELERAKAVAKSTLGAVENALQWVPGSARRIMEGGEPSGLRPEPEQKPAIVEENWDDANVQKFWSLTVTQAQRMAYIRTYLADRDSAEGHEQAAG